MQKTALSAKQRLSLCEKVFKQGYSVSRACREFGVSRFTFYKWAKKYDQSASRNINLANLRDQKRKIKRFAGQAPGIVEEKVKQIAKANPTFSKYRIAFELHKQLGKRAVGVHGVYNILKRSGLTTFQKRLAWSEFVKGAKKRVLNAEEREKILVRAETLEIPVAQVCRDFGISRFTFYKWKKRWEEGGKIIAALQDKKPEFDRKHLRVKPEVEKAVINVVIEAPDLSKYKIAEKIRAKLGPVISSHGVYNVLFRHGLTRPNSRFAYASTHAPQIPVQAGFIDRVRSVLEQFVPTLAPAPPPAVSTTVNTFVKPFVLSTVVAFASLYSLLWWVSLISSRTGANAFGTFFATVSLIAGSIFFLYSLKYYISLAIVLSFSQTEGIGEGASGNEGKRKNILSWILGGRGPSRSSGLETGKRAIGLEPNLERIKLKKHPYVSIHIPFFNEKRVVERSIIAATSMDYKGEYEVILCDDSTDETSTIIRNYQLKHLTRGEKLKTISNKQEGWVLTSAEIRPGVTLKHIHRTSRSGFKGGALGVALKLVHPKTEFISVFDADFVPYPDTIDLFLKYFQASAGTLDFKKALGNRQLGNSSSPQNLQPNPSNIAVVQGYQWHVLNKSENWVTRGVRTEYSGSYVIERSGTEIYNGLKMISGAVYMIRRDVLDEVGWQTSITEDFELTLRIYEKGYKVVYTPYIQAPAECVSTIKRLIRQRMRWAEGHSNNIKKMFTRLLVGHWEQKPGKSTLVNSKPNNSVDALRFTDYERKWVPSPLSLSEKFELLYLAPYYLQALLFLTGTTAWLISETIFPARLPFWTSLWGWSLVLTNLLALPLMNAVGLFLEESEEKDYMGLASFIALTYIMVPFQAYAAVKGFLESEEGTWFRTPKTGKITDVLRRGTFYRFISGILPGRQPAAEGLGTRQLGTSHLKSTTYNLSRSDKLNLLPNAYLSLTTANSRFNNFSIRPRKRKWLGKSIMALALVVLIFLHQLAFYAPPARATFSPSWCDTDWNYRMKITIESDNVGGSADHTDFPVLINSTVTQWKITTSGGNVTQSDGGDIKFYNTSCTKLDHEIEDYVSTTGELVAWVEVPTLDYNTDTDIYIYYNSATAGNQWNIAGTWNSGYELVYHLHDDFNDSTGTSNGSNNGSSDLSGGMAADAQSFDGNDWIDTNFTPDYASSSDVTYEGWFKAGNIGGSDDVMGVEDRGGGGDNSEIRLAVRENDSGSNNPIDALDTWMRPASGAYGGSPSVSPSSSAWHHIAVVRDGSTGRTYYNGSDVDNGSVGTGTIDFSVTLLIGAQWHTSDPDTDRRNYFVHDIDEVRTSTVIRNAGWMLTTYNNGNSPGTFYTVDSGNEEQIPEMVVFLLPLAIIAPLFIKRLQKRREKNYVEARF